MPVPLLADVDFTVVLAVVGFVFDVSFVVDALSRTIAPSVTSGSR